jgi:hypothetical protein
VATPRAAKLAAYWKLLGIIKNKILRFDTYIVQGLIPSIQNKTKQKKERKEKKKPLISPASENLRFN